MDLSAKNPPLIVVVGSGGVGKTTLAAALGLVSAAEGRDTLVMTFDPSRRLKDALGIGEAADNQEVAVASGTPGKLAASLLDARATFDHLVERYAPDEAARRRILENRYYDHLAGHLGGILEYMAVERLYEVAAEGRYDRIILDTPPTAQAIDFLEAPTRIVDFLDSGALKIALAPWFGDDGGLRATSGLGFVGRGLEQFLDKLVGIELLRDMSEFFRAFAPLFDGFRRRAIAARELLTARETLFVLVAGPGTAPIPDALFFARKLQESGCRLGPIVVNRVHPVLERGRGPDTAGHRLFRWLGDSHRQGLEELRALVPDDQAIVTLPLVANEPTDLESLEALGRFFQRAAAQA